MDDSFFAQLRQQTVVQPTRLQSDGEGANGTPDYLAPEVILGGETDSMVDWWAVGIVLYEFLWGIPPFNASTPTIVFEKILEGRIDWPEVPEEISEEARDLIERLLRANPKRRLGAAGGAGAVKSHPFFLPLAWDRILEEDGPFVPVQGVDYAANHSKTVNLTTLDDSSDEDGDDPIGMFGFFFPPFSVICPVCGGVFFFRRTLLLVSLYCAHFSPPSHLLPTSRLARRRRDGRHPERLRLSQRASAGGA